MTNKHHLTKEASFVNQIFKSDLASTPKCSIYHLNFRYCYISLCRYTIQSLRLVPNSWQSKPNLISMNRSQSERAPKLLSDGTEIRLGGPCTVQRLMFVITDTFHLSCKKNFEKKLFVEFFFDSGKKVCFLFFWPILTTWKMAGWLAGINESFRWYFRINFENFHSKCFCQTVNTWSTNI